VRLVPGLKAGASIAEALRLMAQFFHLNGIEDADADARILLAHALHLDRAQLLAQSDRCVGPPVSGTHNDRVEFLKHHSRTLRLARQTIAPRLQNGWTPGEPSWRYFHVLSVLLKQLHARETSSRPGPR